MSPFQLELELPKFIQAELFDIVEKLPLYEEYLARTEYMVSSIESRLQIQISVLRHYLPMQCDVSILRGFLVVRVMVNHQSLFTHFDWSKERLSVSILSFLNHPEVN